MNPDTPQTPREQLEMRVTALLLGELTAEEATALRAVIAKDPQLAALEERLMQTIAFVRETAASPAEEMASQPAPLKLSAARREQLFAKFKTVTPKEFVRPRVNYLKWLIPMSAAAAVMLMLSALLLPALSRAKSKSQRVSVLNNLKQLDGAKQEWALENKASADAVPTMSQLTPYLGRGFDRQLESVAGEKYVPGKVGEPPSVELEADKARKLANTGLAVKPSATPGKVALTFGDVVTPDLASELLTKETMFAGAEAAKPPATARPSGTQLPANVYSADGVGYVDVPLTEKPTPPVRTTIVLPSTTDAAETVVDKPVELAMGHGMAEGKDNRFYTGQTSDDVGSLSFLPRMGGEVAGTAGSGGRGGSGDAGNGREPAGMQMTAISSTSLNGYVDTSAHWNSGSGNENLPKYGFNSSGKADGFNLNSVLTRTSKPAEENKWGDGRGLTEGEKQLQTRTIRVDPNTFEKGLEKVVGIPFGASADGIAMGGGGGGGVGGGGGGGGGGMGGGGTRFATGSSNSAAVTYDYNTRELTVRGTAQDLEQFDQATQLLSSPTRQQLVKGVDWSDTPQEHKGVNWTGTLQAEKFSFGNNSAAPTAAVPAAQPPTVAPRSIVTTNGAQARGANLFAGTQAGINAPIVSAPITYDPTAQSQLVKPTAGTAATSIGGSLIGGSPVPANAQDAASFVNNGRLGQAQSADKVATLGDVPQLGWAFRQSGASTPARTPAGAVTVQEDAFVNYDYWHGGVDESVRRGIAANNSLSQPARVEAEVNKRSTEFRAAHPESDVGLNSDFADLGKFGGQMIGGVVSTNHVSANLRGFYDDSAEKLTEHSVLTESGRQAVSVSSANKAYRLDANDIPSTMAQNQLALVPRPDGKFDVDTAALGVKVNEDFNPTGYIPPGKITVANAEEAGRIKDLVSSGYLNSDKTIDDLLYELRSDSVNRQTSAASARGSELAAAATKKPEPADVKQLASDLFAQRQPTVQEREKESVTRGERAEIVLPAGTGTTRDFSKSANAGALEALFDGRLGLIGGSVSSEVKLPNKEVVSVDWITRAEDGKAQISMSQLHPGKTADGKWDANITSKVLTVPAAEARRIAQLADSRSPETGKAIEELITKAGVSNFDGLPSAAGTGKTGDYPNSTKPGPVQATYDPQTGQFVVITDDKTFASVDMVLKATDRQTNAPQQLVALNGRLVSADEITVLQKRVDDLRRKLNVVDTDPNGSGRGSTLGPMNAMTNGSVPSPATQPYWEAKAELDKKRAQVQELAQHQAKPPVKADTDPAVPKRVSPPPIPQPEVLVRENAFSTFSLNVSDVSFKLAAASLEKGTLPEPGNVRAEEFINAFDYRDPEPTAAAAVGFAWERAHYPFAHNRDLLRFSLKTAAAGRQADRPLNIVLLLDNSGSMERADRVEIIHEALRVLASQLKPQDRVSVITFSRLARLWVDGIAGNQAGDVLKQVGNLTPEGGTNLEEAMRLAYATALRHYFAKGMNRVVLLTDGAANLGNVNPESLKQMVETQRKQGVALDCFGIGWEGYNDDLLEVLSRNGDGRYGFINSADEAATDFAGQLAGALQVAASDVKVQVEFNPKRVTSYRQIGYAKHQLKKEQFRDNTVDAAEIAAAEAGNALYTVELNPAGEGPVATVRVRYKTPGTSNYYEKEWAVPYNGPAVALEQGSPAIRLAGTAAAFAEWLAQSPFAAEVTPGKLLGELNGVTEVYGVDPRPKQLETMIRQAQSVSGQ